MPNPIGVTFAPTTDQAANAKKNWSAAGGAPEAVQVLSLHVPQFAGTRALSPDALLQAPSGGHPVQSVVESILRNLGHEPNFNPPAPAGSPSVGDEQNGLLSLIRQAIGQASQQRFEPTPSVTPGVLPGEQPQPPQVPPAVTREWEQPPPPPFQPPQAPPVSMGAQRQMDKQAWNTNPGMQF